MLPLEELPEIMVHRTFVWVNGVLEGSPVRQLGSRGKPFRTAVGRQNQAVSWFAPIASLNAHRSALVLLDFDSH